MKLKKSEIFFYFIFVASLYVFYHVSMFSGVLKERSSQECISPEQSNKITKSEELNSALMQGIFLNHDQAIEKCLSEKQKWRDNYFICQQAKCKTEL